MIAERYRILCVDDEAGVLEGLDLILGRRFKVETATSGAAGLDTLERCRDVAVVISDMRMPHMDGAAFLSKVRTVAPDAIRILLTGQSDMKSAISAVNEGQIFRFLTKPCAPASLTAAIDAACEQRRLLTAEKVLLEETLQGSIKALVDVLAIVNPMAFGRAARIKKTTLDVVDKLGLQPRWQVECAAMLWPLGFVGVSPETSEKLFYGRPLDEAEKTACSRAPDVVEQLIGHIPRLEQVRAILASAARPTKIPAPDIVQRGAAILRLAIELDTLETQGLETALAVETLRGRDAYPPEILGALVAVYVAPSQRVDVRELPPSALRPGMVFAEDVKFTSGALLVARGGEVTAGFLARARNFPDGTMPSRIRVIVPQEKP